MRHCFLGGGDVPIVLSNDRHQTEYIIFYLLLSTVHDVTSFLKSLHIRIAIPTRTIIFANKGLNGASLVLAMAKPNIADFETLLSVSQ